MNRKLLNRVESIITNREMINKSNKPFRNNDLKNNRILMMSLNALAGVRAKPAFVANPQYCIFT